MPHFIHPSTSDAGQKGAPPMETAYRGLAEVYDRLMADMPYPDWIRMTREAWSRCGFPATLVELGCGTGNIAIPLAEQGVQVIAMDVSEDMLSMAQQKAVNRLRGHGAGGSVRFVRQDMRDWMLDEPVDCVVSYCDSLNYVTEPDELEQVFRQTHAGLKPGGLFLFDVLPPEQLKRYAEGQPYYYNADDIAYLWTVEYDDGISQIRHELTIFVLDEPSGLYRRIDETHVQRAYAADWIVSRLERCGFADIRIAADFRWEQPPDERAARMFFAARKP